MKNLSFDLSEITCSTVYSNEQRLNSFQLDVPVHVAETNQGMLEASTLKFGKVVVLTSAPRLSGNLMVEYDQPETEEAFFLEGSIQNIRLDFDDEASGEMWENAQIQFSMPSDLFQEEASFIQTKELTEAPEEASAECICSQVITMKNELGEEEDLEYFILPDSTDEDLVYPQSVEKGGNFLWHFTYSRSLVPDYNEPAEPKRKKRFLFRLFRKNTLKDELKKLKEQPDFKGLSGDGFYDKLIGELKKIKKVEDTIHEGYSIKIYDPALANGEVFRKIKDITEVNPDLKTLIIIPGTFKKSLEKKDGKWTGSFIYLIKEKTGDSDNWFQYLLTKGGYEQIITLEHDSIFDSLYDNVEYFITRLGLGNIRFTQPTAILSASRGGFLAKLLARIDAGLDDRFPAGTLHLKIEKIITVANGFSGYVDPANVNLLKKKIQLLFNILNLLSFGRLRGYLWLLSFTPGFILRLPGLRGQAKDSEEIDLILSKDVPNLFCLPLANNYNMKGFRFVERTFVEPFLGPDSDFVLSFESQQNVRPGQLMLRDPIERTFWGPITGTHIHGKGLSDVHIRTEIVEFLNARPATTQAPAAS